MPRLTRPLSDRICDATVLVFAVWTIVCNCCVAAGASLVQLITAATVVALCAAAVALIMRRRFSFGHSEPRERTPSAERLPNGRRWPPITLSIAATAITIALVHYGHGKLAWTVMFANFLCAAFAQRHTNDDVSPAVRTSDYEAVVWGLAVVCAVFALVVHRPNADDCFYINASVGAVDEPDQPLLKWDTMHGVPGVPLLLPAYRVHSIELWVAAVSKLTGLEAIKVSHLVLPALGAIFCCLAWARSARVIVSSGWIWVLVGIAIVMLLVGAPIRWYSNFGLMRLQQGKSLLVAACVPLLIAYTVEFSAAPSWRGWIRLAAAQIAGMGLSSTALWLAPAVVGLAALSVVRRPIMRHARTLLLAAASTSYVLLAGLVVRAAMQGHPELPGLCDVPDQALLSAFELVLGNGLLRDASLAVLLLTWCVCPGAVSRRLCTLYPLGALLTVLNPYLATRIATSVVGGPTFFRVLWILPLPMFIAIVLSAPMTTWRAARLPCVRPVAYVAGILILLTVITPCMTFSRQNEAEVGWPGKIVPAEYAVAEHIVHLVRPRAHVLAPVEVALWAPTFHRHPYPLVSRDLYAFLLTATSGDECNRRLALEAYVAGKTRTDNAARLLTESLRRDDLELVCLRRRCGWLLEIVAELKKAGFVRVEGDGEYENWLKRPKRRD